MKKAAGRLCKQVDCQNSVTGRALYCSRRCSAWVRNRRYYGSLNGRSHKRAAARRYFQRRRQELYDRRAKRFEGYVNEILRGDHEFLRDLVDPFRGRTDSTPLELAMEGARKLAQVQHDWNPKRQGDSSVGRPYYATNEKGQLVPGIFHSDVGGWTPVGKPVDASRFVKPDPRAAQMRRLTGERM